jgi:hypothetical protein
VESTPRIAALGNGMFIRIIWGSWFLAVFVFHIHFEVRAIELLHGSELRRPEAGDGDE